MWFSRSFRDPLILTFRRVQSMTFARPTMISEPSSLSYPTIIDDEFISMNPGFADAIQPTDVASRMAYFVETLRLSDIRYRFRKYV